MLINAGIGTRWSERERQIHGIDQSQSSLAAELARVGVAPEAITDVVLTHLHFDHAGGVTRLSTGGQIELTFPEPPIISSEDIGTGPTRPPGRRLPGEPKREPQARWSRSATALAISPDSH